MLLKTAKPRSSKIMSSTDNINAAENDNMDSYVYTTKGQTSLCLSCRYILDQDPAADESATYHLHHETQRALLEAAGNGCRICQRVVRWMRSTEDGSLPVEWNDRYTWAVYKNECPGMCFLDIYADSWRNFASFVLEPTSGRQFETPHRQPYV